MCFFILKNICSQEAGHKSAADIIREGKRERDTDHYTTLNLMIDTGNTGK